jgi:hypothetical protein
MYKDRGWLSLPLLIYRYPERNKKGRTEEKERKQREKVHCLL